MARLHMMLSTQSIREVIKRHNLQLGKNGKVRLTVAMMQEAKAIDDAQKRGPSKEFVELMRKNLEDGENLRRLSLTRGRRRKKRH
jgi:hypothetical protein